MLELNNKLKHFSIHNPIYLLEGYYIKCRNCKKQYYPNNKYDINMRTGE